MNTNDVKTTWSILNRAINTEENISAVQLEYQYAAERGDISEECILPLSRAVAECFNGLYHTALSRHSQNVQEGLSVAVECAMELCLQADEFMRLIRNYNPEKQAFFTYFMSAVHNNYTKRAYEMISSDRTGGLTNTLSRRQRETVSTAARAMAELSFSIPYEHLSDEQRDEVISRMGELGCATTGQTVERLMRDFTLSEVDSYDGATDGWERSQPTADIFEDVYADDCVRILDLMRQMADCGKASETEINIAMPLIVINYCRDVISGRMNTAARYKAHLTGRSQEEILKGLSKDLPSYFIREDYAELEGFFNATEILEQIEQMIEDKGKFPTRTGLFRTMFPDTDPTNMNKKCDKIARIIKELL